MKTLFEAASVVVLIAFSQLAFGTHAAVRPATDGGASMTSNASPSDSNGHGQLVKPLSL